MTNLQILAVNNIIEMIRDGAGKLCDVKFKNLGSCDSENREARYKNGSIAERAMVTFFESIGIRVEKTKHTQRGHDLRIYTPQDFGDDTETKVEIKQRTYSPEKDYKLDNLHVSSYQDGFVHLIILFETEVLPDGSVVIRRLLAVCAADVFNSTHLSPNRRNLKKPKGEEVKITGKLFERLCEERGVVYDFRN